MSPFRCRARLVRGKKKRSAWAASLRPKTDGSIAHFYSLVTRESRDQEFATHRQLFLTEQGYRYEIIDAEKLLLNIPERV